MELTKKFREIKKSFFRKREDWTVKWDHNIPCQARCDFEAKNVKVNYLGDRTLELILIHELCHSPPGCRTGTHGKVWQEQLLKKARIADKKGFKELGQELRDEAQMYQKAMELGAGTHSDVYQRVEDIIMDCPNISYDDLVEGVAQEYGSTREELEEGFRQLMRYFKKAKRFWTLAGEKNDKTAL